MSLPTVTVTVVMTVEGTLDAVGSAFSGQELQDISDYVVTKYRKNHESSVPQNPLAGTASTIDADADATVATATRATIA